MRDRRDTKDNRCPGSAPAAGTGALLTGDEDPLALYPWRGVLVLRPAEFLRELGGGRS